MRRFASNRFGNHDASASAQRRPRSSPSSTRQAKGSYGQLSDACASAYAVNRLPLLQGFESTRAIRFERKGRGLAVGIDQHGSELAKRIESRHGLVAQVDSSGFAEGVAEAFHVGRRGRQRAGSFDYLAFPVWLPLALFDEVEWACGKVVNGLGLDREVFHGFASPLAGVLVVMIRNRPGQRDAAREVLVADFHTDRKMSG